MKPETKTKTKLERLRERSNLAEQGGGIDRLVVAVAVFVGGD